LACRGREAIGGIAQRCKDGINVQTALRMQRKIDSEARGGS
jgi:hypothetical protein